MGGKRRVLGMVMVLVGVRGIKMRRRWWWRGWIVVLEVAGQVCGYGVEDAHFNLRRLGRWEGGKVTEGG